MASLTLTIGTLTATYTATNAKAQNVLLRYAAAIGADGTNQEKADAVVNALVRHMIEEGKRDHRNAAMATAAATVQAEIDELTWE